MRPLTGLWRRLAIEYPDGTGDTTTEVYWLQAGTLYADLRIPAGRPLCAQQMPAGLSEEMRRMLAAQEGFAGETQLAGDRCTWHRWIDCRPPSLTPDEGRLAFNGRMLVEFGIHVPYIEHWWHETDGDGEYAGFRLHGGYPGLLLVVGDHFMRATVRQAEIKAGPIKAAGEDQRQLGMLLACEISFGCCEGRPADWTILRSTHPWQEGTPLFPAGGPRYFGDGGQLIEPLRDQSPRLWHLCESSGSAAIRMFGAA